MRLKELRIIHNLSQIELAEEVNVSNKTISRYETGQREPDLATLISLAEYFHVSLDELVGYTPKGSELSEERLILKLSSLSDKGLDKLKRLLFSDDEVEIIKKYHQLSADDKTKFNKIADAFIYNVPLKEK